MLGEVACAFWGGRTITHTHNSPGILYRRRGRPASRPRWMALTRIRSALLMSGSRLSRWGRAGAGQVTGDKTGAKGGQRPSLLHLCLLHPHPCHVDPRPDLNLHTSPPLPPSPPLPQHLVSRVSTFFFVLMDMSLVRHVYQFSLSWFMQLFSEALQHCPRANTGEVQGGTGEGRAGNHWGVRIGVGGVTFLLLVASHVTDPSHPALTHVLNLRPGTAAQPHPVPPPLSPAPSGQARLHSLTLFFASLLYQGTSRSLFDEDRLPFAVFLMARYMVVSVIGAWHMCDECVPALGFSSTTSHSGILNIPICSLTHTHTYVRRPAGRPCRGRLTSSPFTHIHTSKLPHFHL